MRRERRHSLGWKGTILDFGEGPAKVGVGGKKGVRRKIMTGRKRGE